MNIKELKEIIKDLPDEMEVMCSDSEYGDNTAWAEVRIRPPNDYIKEERKYLRIY